MAHPIRVLGPGRRVVLWVQGCSRHCSGCASADTWDHGTGCFVDVDELGNAISKVVVEEGLDGLTVTGGEPLEQAEAVLALSAHVREQLASRASSERFDILVFSGFDWDQVRLHAPMLVEKVDAMVCGPYEELRSCKGRLIASDNQELVVLNERVRSRFESYAHETRKFLQFDMGETGAYFVGMPELGDLARLEEALEKRGVMLGDASWRPENVHPATI